MLKEGQIVTIDGDKYRVTKVPRGVLACLGMCNITRCNENEDFIQLKRVHNVKSCTQLMGLGYCLKKIVE